MSSLNGTCPALTLTTTHTHTHTQPSQCCTLASILCPTLLSFRFRHRLTPCLKYSLTHTHTHTHTLTCSHTEPQTLSCCSWSAVTAAFRPLTPRPVAQADLGEELFISLRRPSRVRLGLRHVVSHGPAGRRRAARAGATSTACV